MGNNVIIIEQDFNAAASKVWNAITDKDEMKIWYFDLEAFKPDNPDFALHNFEEGWAYIINASLKNYLEK